MTLIDATYTTDATVRLSNARSITVAHSAAVGKDSTGPFRAVMTGVRHQPLRDERGLLVFSHNAMTGYHTESVPASVCPKLTECTE